MQVRQGPGKHIFLLHIPPELEGKTEWRVDIGSFLGASLHFTDTALVHMVMVEILFRSGQLWVSHVLSADVELRI